jgi:transgelin
MSKSAQGSRGAGFGLDAELARKQAEKYDHGAEKLAIDWIEAVTGEKLEGSFGTALKNGQILCKLINAIKPGSVKKIETSAMPFKQMENISNFLRACRALGVREYELFETVDLYEEKVALHISVYKPIHILYRT